MPKIKITLNQYGQPVGKNSRKFSSVLGCQVRRKISVGCSDWRLVKPEKKYEVWTDIKVSLRETAHMPCARKFAVCPMSGTRQTILLPCALDSEHGNQRAHGEQHFCRVSIKKTHGKLQPHGKILNPVTPVSYLPCAYGLNPRQTLNTRQTFQTHNGKKNLPCAVPWHSANNHICRVFYMFVVCLGPSTRQSIDKKVKLTLPIFFSGIHLLCMDHNVTSWYFSNSLCYI